MRSFICLISNISYHNSQLHPGLLTAFVDGLLLWPVCGWAFDAQGIGHVREELVSVQSIIPVYVHY